MADGGTSLTKKIVLGVLTAICAVLVYQNLIAPAAAPVSRSAPAAGSAATQLARQRQTARRVSPGDPARRDKAMDQEELAALDPTLQLDLLEKTAQVKYQGDARNIFQYYVPPPPKPVQSPIVQAPAQPVAPAPPPPPTIGLKFYGVSSRAGASEKKAFLTDGEQIFIGQEGEVIAKRYKIVRIGVGSLDWEDVLSHQSGQLAMIQE